MRKMKTKTLVSLIAIAVVVAVAMFAGCVEEKEAPTQVPTPTPTQVSTPIPTYQDSEYMEWAMETSRNIISNQEQITNSIIRLDFESLEKYSGMLYDDARKALTEIDKFSVSPKYTPSKDELKFALQDFKQAGYYLEREAMYSDDDDTQTAREYLKSASTHIGRCKDLMPDEMASYSATTPMQTPIISTTPTQVSTQIPTYQDSEYIEWVWETIYNILSIYAKTASSLNRPDLESVEKYSGMLYDDARKALTEIDKFSLSPKYTPSNDELKLALQDYKQIGYYLKRAVRYSDDDDIQMSLEYIESASTHFRRWNDLMPDEMASYSTTTHTMRWNDLMPDEMASYSATTPMQTQKISTTKQTAKQKSNAIQLKVIYSGSWSGSYGDIGNIKSVDGTGTETFTLSKPEFIVTASMQKQDDSSSTLTVEILKNGKVVKSESTSAAYGVVLISYTL